MAGLISTDALLKRTDWYSPNVRDAVRNALRYVPTVDAVEVVRCKDCKHNSLNRTIGNTYCDLGIGLSQLYDYCSHGERRENEYNYWSHGEKRANEID